MTTGHSPPWIFDDGLVARGGAEQVNLELARRLQAVLCIGHRDAALFSNDCLSDLQVVELNAARPRPPLRQISLMRAFARRSPALPPRTAALFTGICAPVAVHTVNAARSVHYCHAAPAFAFDLEDFYRARTPAVLRPLFRGFVRWFRPRYIAALRGFDVIYANSDFTAEQLRRATGCRVLTLAPPIDGAPFRWRPPAGYWVSTARLEPHKRVDLAIDAFAQMPDQQLIIVGDGSEAARLKRRAADHDNVRFTGMLDRARMGAVVSRSIGSLHLARDEPFGLAVVESLAAEKPVIATRSGGPADLISTPSCGALLDEPSNPNAVAAAVRALGTRATDPATRSACRATALRFRGDGFFDTLDRALRGDRL